MTVHSADARTPVKGLDYLEPEGEGHVWITVPRPSPSNDKLSSRVIERFIQGHRTSYIWDFDYISYSRRFWFGGGAVFECSIKNVNFSVPLLLGEAAVGDASNLHVECVL